MAATNYGTFALAFLSLYSFFVLCIHVVPCASAISLDFNFSSPGEVNPCDKALKCVGDAYFANSVIELTKNDRSRESGGSQGRVWYANPVPLWDAATGELASFSSVFSFLIKTDGTHMNPDGSLNTGDGMAFFLARYSDDGGVLNNTGGGGSLGLFNYSNLFNATGDDRVVAVEFDTYPNTWDTSPQHVGIDVNSISSVASTSTYLISNIRMTATVRWPSASLRPPARPPSCTEYCRGRSILHLDRRV